jgi:serine/threonine protein phosphatase PrpC
MHCAQTRSNLFCAHASATFKCGWKAQAVVAQGCPTYQEDRVVMKSLGSTGCALLAVFDGHGGSAAATLASQLCTAIIQHEQGIEKASREPLGTHTWTKIMTNAFLFIDEIVVSSTPLERGTWSGAAACIVVITPHEIVSANVGDSRSVMTCTSSLVTRLSNDHTPREDVQDTKRVQSMGGTIDRSGYVRFPSGVTTGLAGLAMTRSLGDKEGKRGATKHRHIISAKPHVRVTRMRATIQSIVVASDGVWDVVSDTEASRAVTAALRAGVDPSTFLLYGSLGLWADRRVSKDNMSCVVAWRPSTVATSPSSPDAWKHILTYFTPHDAEKVQSAKQSIGVQNCLQAALLVTASHMAQKTNLIIAPDPTSTKPFSFPCLVVGIAPGGFVWIRTDRTPEHIAEYARAAGRKKMTCMEPLQIGDAQLPHIARALQMLPKAERPTKHAQDVRWADFTFPLRHLH